MAVTVGVYAATLSGSASAEILGATGDITVNAPGVGDVSVTWVLNTVNTDDDFGAVTGASVAIQNAPGVGVTYDVLLRVEDGSGNLLGGGTDSIKWTDTATSIDFGDDLDPKAIENAIVVHV